MDVFDNSSLFEGEINYIIVDRFNILKIKFIEFEFIVDFCKIFEVDFMGEEVIDLGGFRKEWICFMNYVMKEKYFVNGLWEFFLDEYYFIGVMMGIVFF